MRIAVVLLSYAAPQVLPLHAAYHAGIADLFVHVDAKVPAADIPPCPTVHFIERRHLNWGGWSQLATVLELLATAQAAGPYDRYLLISDDTAPLMPPGSLVAALTETADLIPIDMNPPEWSQRRYRRFLYFDHPATSPRTGEPEARELDGPFFAAMEEAATLWKTTGKKPVALGHGHAWWALTGATVDRVLHEYRTDDWMRLSFKFSANPDEQYIQTLIGHPSDGRFMFADFTREPRPYIFRDTESIKSAAPPGFLYVRKVDTTAPAIAELIRTGNLGR